MAKLAERDTEKYLINKGETSPVVGPGAYEIPSQFNRKPKNKAMHSTKRSLNISPTFNQSPLRNLSPDSYQNKAPFN